MCEAPARHALLFELLRQDNLARKARDNYDPSEVNVSWQTAFTLKALASLRG